MLNHFKVQKHWQALIVCMILLPLWANSEYAVKKSPVKLVNWRSTEGLTRLSNSTHRADFSRLSSQFQNQVYGTTCGPTTGAIVLNALRIGKSDALPKTSFDDKYRKHLKKNYDPRVSRYTPESFMNERIQKVKSWLQVYGETTNGKRNPGLPIRQLHKIFLAHGVKSKLRIVKDLSNQQVKRELISNLGREGDYVVVNYKRSTLGQKGGGHISPLGAYDRNTDSFLIMDVNSSRHNWVWVKAEDIISAMRTHYFTVENRLEHRGYLLIREQNPLFPFLWRKK